MEIWKEIANYENYEVSNMGNVRNVKTGKHLKTRLGPNGYFSVFPCKEGNRKTLYVHRIVCETFIDNPNNKNEVDHKNGNKTDNKKDNLRWATRTENLRNVKLSSLNTSGVKGVYFSNRDKVYIAKIHIDGINYHLGSFKTLDEAKQARINKANQVFGEFKNVCEN